MDTHKNVKFMCADVTSPNLHILKLVTYISFRSRENLVSTNLEIQRENITPTLEGTRFYTKVLKECHMSGDKGGSFLKFLLLAVHALKLMFKKKKNQIQICWISQRVGSGGSRGS